MTRVATLRRRQQHIADFAESLARLLDVLEPGEGSFGGYPSWTPKRGYEQEAARRAAEVDRLSGSAALALTSIGVVIDWKPRGTMQTRPVNPAGAWRTILDQDPMFPPDMILGVCNQAIGALDAVAADAHEEGSLRGVSRRRQNDGGGHGLVLALIVAVAAGLLVAYLTYFFGWTG